MGIKDILVYSILKIKNFIIDSVHNFIYELPVIYYEKIVLICIIKNIIKNKVS